MPVGIAASEGPTDDPKIIALRQRQRRNFLATLLLSQGVPMLLGGDEYGRTQQGNNNAYCQDDEISWLDWDLSKASEQLLSYTRGIIKLRNDHPVFRRPKFFQGRKIRGQDVKDIMWFNPGGTEMTDDEWNSGFVRCLGMLLSGKAIDVRDEHGEPIVDDTFLVLFNAHFGTQKFVLPGRVDVHWGLLVDTCEDTGFIEPVRTYQAGQTLKLLDRSVCVLRLVEGEESSVTTR